MSESLVNKKIFWEVFHFASLVLSVFLLAFSVFFGFSRVPLFGLFEIKTSYVKKFLLLNIILTALVILVHSWLRRKFDDDIDESLKEFDKLWNGKDEVTKSFGKFFQKYFLFLICCALTMI